VDERILVRLETIIMWKSIVAVFVVALIATVGITNMDYFFPAERPVDTTHECDLGEPSSCSTVAVKAPSCCATSCCSDEEEVVVTAEPKIGAGMLIGGAALTK